LVATLWIKFSVIVYSTPSIIITIFFFWDRVSLCSPSWPQTWEPPSSASLLESQSASPLIKLSLECWLQHSKLIFCDNFYSILITWPILFYSLVCIAKSGLQSTRLIPSDILYCILLFKGVGDVVQRETIYLSSMCAGLGSISEREGKGGEGRET
jgi:hypothetical protein